MKTKKTGIQKEFGIEGFPNYFYSTEQKLYRITTKGEFRENKLMMIGYTKGYVLMSKFHSLTKLKTLFRKNESVEE